MEQLANPAPVSAPPRRRLPIGAEIIDARTHVRVSAPAASRAEVACSSSARGADPGSGQGREHDGTNAPDTLQLTPEPGGYFSGWIDARAGDRYWFRLDDGQARYPDPASRYQ